MESVLGPEFFKGNRNKLRQLFAGTAPIVITANGLLQRSGDTNYQLHQDRNFWYLTGIDEADAILVIDKNKEYLILSEVHEYRVRFDSSLTDDDIAKKSGIAEVLDYKSGWKQLNKRIRNVKHVATLSAAPKYIPFHGFYANPARATLIEKIKETNSDVKILDLRKHLAKLRMIKQPSELEAIQKAINITEQSIKSVTKKSWSNKTTELDIARQIEYEFYKKEASGIGFDTVVAAGKNTCPIHHMPDSTKLNKNELLLFDIGAEVEHYCADISRVFVIGDASKRTKQIYSVVSQSLEYALSQMRPGITYKQYEKNVSQYVGEKLRELGLIKSISKESVRKYFPHYTSHHLGLDPHDAMDPEAVFKPNMVFAVEPGVYIPEEGIGMRIEDNVLLTEDGIKLMSTLPRELTSLTIK